MLCTKMVRDALQDFGRALIARSFLVPVLTRLRFVNVVHEIRRSAKKSRVRLRRTYTVMPMSHAWVGKWHGLEWGKFKSPHLHTLTLPLHTCVRQDQSFSHESWRSNKC